MSDMVEQVARIIANAMGDNYSDAFKNKERWNAKRGMSGGRIRDVNEPMQCDYLAAAEAAQDVLAGRGNGTYDEALDAIRWLLQSAGIYDAPVAWIVGNGNGDRWRAWKDGNPVWVEDREKATRYARREDAEAVHGEDEDAWRVVPYTPVADRVSTSKPVVAHETGNTSDKLRDAVDVWRDAYDAYTDFYCHTTEKDPAAVIEAYVQERLAAKDADFEKLKRAWKIQYDEKVKERAEAKLWFEKAQQWRRELAKYVSDIPENQGTLE